MPQLTDFQAALFDADKTLTNSQRIITPSTRAALDRLAQQGIVTGYCTGKHYGKLVQEKIENIFPPEALHVVSGGAQVVDGKGAILWEKLLNVDVERRIFELAEKERVPFVLKHPLKVHMNQVALEFYERTKNPVLSIAEPMGENSFIPSPAVVLVSPTPAVLQELAQIPEVSFKTMELYTYTVVDVTARGITKASGLKEWSRLKNIPLDKIIGFGDSENDLEFLSEVGFAVALGNATDSVKAVADLVIGHTDAEGLALYLEKVVSTGSL
jgi:Cof subfamily protein (haloacid dehalogenase superfamily)